MNYISVENLSRNYGERVLFEGLHFGLNKGDKVALIANNGAGKSSMLKILAGRDHADDGEVVIRSGVRVGFLEQEPQLDETLTIQELFEGGHSDVLKVILDYEQALENQSREYNTENQRAFERATAMMDEVKAWDYERRVRQILTKFNIHDLSQRIGQLSGGQKKRIALALVLLDNPELLILDEPTNHLDVDMIEWLEKYLSQSHITLLMVTHDRYFLDRVCNRILELSDSRLYTHKGNYSYFLQKKAEREEVARVELAKANRLLKKEQEWMRRMPKARTTKSKSRIDAFYDLKEKATGKKKEAELKLEVKMSRVGGKVLEMKKVYKSYGDLQILKGFDYTFKKGERIGVVGKNGAGKTTFLNLVTGVEQPDSGKINSGDTIVYGYYAQQGIRLKTDKRVIDVLKDIAEVITLANGSKMTASQFLQYFMFPPKMQQTFVSKLSGGERRRLYLLTVLIKNPNFLILDEPTNDLDLLTINKLEEFLSEFGGCLLLVSHDRYFMDQLVDQLFVFKGDGEIKGFVGTYSEYRMVENELEKERQREAKKAEAAPPTTSKEVNKKKLTYKDKLEYERLEAEIEELEAKKQELEEVMNASTTDYEKLAEVGAALGDIVDQIDEKTMRWMELDELAQGG